MIDGNQLREEFGRYLAEHKATRWGMDAALMHVCKIAYDAGKADGPGAALHIQRGAVLEGWKEATIAWEVCASIHREYAKKKDPFFTTRQADFVKHTEAARSALLAAAPDQFRDAAKMMAEPAEVPMPEPDATLHDDGYFVAKYQLRTSYDFSRAGWRLDVISMATASTYGVACRAAGEAAGYARGLADERERICAAIKAEDDYCVTEGDYMLDSDDCIRVARGTWERPDYALRGEVKP